MWTIYFLFLITFSSCVEKKSSDSVYDSEVKQLSVEVLLGIGSENQGDEYQLGKPIGVRTDEYNNIYIADRASLSIKVYNENGEFIKTIGRRGRGPGEFLDINSFEINPDGNFFILDRGTLSYTHISIDESYFSRYSMPFNRKTLEGQFYPDDLDYYEDKAIILYTDSHFVKGDTMSRRKLFFLYDREVRERFGSFFDFTEFKDLVFTTFVFAQFIGKPGSFFITETGDELYYSPRIYHGNIYHLVKTGDSWKTHKIIQTHDFGVDSYVQFSNSDLQKYRRQGVPGLRNTFYGGRDPHIGRVNTYDAGIHELKDGRVMVFTAKWRDELDKEGDHEELIDIYAQVIDEDKVEFLGRMISVEANKEQNKPYVNWMDKDENFYLLDYSGINYPSVTKFKIEEL